jgi:hypothetical protein
MSVAPDGKDKSGDALISYDDDGEKEGEKE